MTGCSDSRKSNTPSENNSDPRSLSEEVVRVSQERLRFMFDAMRDGLMLISAEGQIEDVNDAQLRILGAAAMKNLLVLTFLILFQGKIVRGSLWFYQ